LSGFSIATSLGRVGRPRPFSRSGKFVSRSHRFSCATIWSRALLSAFIATLLSSFPIPSKAAAALPPYQYFRIGNPKNIHVSARPGYALIGGGKDLDEAFVWLCGRAADGDFLTIRASGTGAYNPYIQSLCHVNSVATLIIPSRAAANDPFVSQTIRAASVIFIAGGDQANYVNFWSSTPVQRALNDAVRRGIPMGGTSAGLAILGEFAYSAQNDSPDGPDLTSGVAVANPFQPQVVLVRNFLRISPLHGVITDSHFHNRDRLGRLIVFMARILASSDAKRIHAIGVDQTTAFLLDPSGSGVVAGSGAAYFFEATGKPFACRPGVPLTFRGVSVRKLVAGEKFDLKHWTGAGIGYTLSVDSGVLRSTQPNQSIY
jgi:cyanophycinase